MSLEFFRWERFVETAQFLIAGTGTNTGEEKKTKLLKVLMF